MKICVTASRVHWMERCFLVICIIITTIVITIEHRYIPRRIKAANRTSKPETTHLLMTDIGGEVIWLQKQICLPSKTWDYAYPWMKTWSDMTDWSYRTKWKCPKTLPGISRLNVRLRRKTELGCTEGSETLIPTYSTSKSSIDTLDFGDPCLEKVIENCCEDTKPVPNVVHFVWYFDKEMGFYEFTTFFSAIKYIKPCLILIHGDYVPRGKYWDHIINIYPNIVQVRRKRPTTIFGKQILFHEHSGDVMRIEALLRYGGIYLDTDQFLVRSVDFLRRYPCTLSIQYSGLVSIGFIMAEKNASFLELWYDRYKTDFRNSEYKYNSMTVTALLARRYRTLLHVDYATLSREDVARGDQIYHSNYDWSKIYGIHMYKRIYNGTVNERVIRTFNTTAGSLFRHILFGNKALCL